MWLKRVLLNMRYQLTANHVRRHVSQHKPHRRFCEDLLKELSAEQFRHYRPAAGLGVNFVARYSNIETYTNRMREATRLVKTERMIPPEWAHVQETVVSLDRFLITEDGYYVKPSNAIAAFKVAGLELCAVMEKSDTETHGLPEHNLRMLTKLFVNLRDITTCLIEVSFQH